LLLYFLERLRVLGIHHPARHFVTLTEENSYLGELAGEYNFLDNFLDPPGVHGRYSSLIHFNFFLAALCRSAPGDLLARTQSIDACGPSAPGEANPALSLGAFLAAAEIEGLDRLVFFSTDSLKPVARRIGYLVGASTGKKVRGIVPIFGRSSYRLEMLQLGCFVAILKMAGEEDRELGRRHDELREADVPMVSKSFPRARRPGEQDQDRANIGADRDQAPISCIGHARARRRSRAVCRGQNTPADLHAEYDRGTANLSWIAASERLYRVATLCGLWGGPRK